MLAITSPRIRVAFPAPATLGGEHIFNWFRIGGDQVEKRKAGPGSDGRGEGEIWVKRPHIIYT